MTAKFVDDVPALCAEVSAAGFVPGAELPGGVLGFVVEGHFGGVRAVAKLCPDDGVSAGQVAALVHWAPTSAICGLLAHGGRWLVIEHLGRPRRPHPRHWPAELDALGRLHGAGVPPAGLFFDAATSIVLDMELVARRNAEFDFAPLGHFERLAQLGLDAAGAGLPVVLCHSDAHRGNVFVQPDGSVRFIDPLAAVAPAEFDLGCWVPAGGPEAFDLRLRLARQRARRGDLVELFAAVRAATRGLALRAHGVVSDAEARALTRRGLQYLSEHG